MKIKEYFDLYLSYIAAKGRTAKTVVEHRRFLDNILASTIGERDIMSLRKVDVALIEGAGRAHGEHGPSRAVVVLRRLMNYIEDRGDQIPFSWRDIQIPSIPKVPIYSLSDEEMDLIRNNLDISNMAGLRTRTLIEVLCDTGLRIGEAISLNKKDINYELKEAEVVNIKTGQLQKVYFTDRSLEWIKLYLSKRKDDLEALFVSGRSRMLACTSRNYINKYLNNIGITKRVHHHLFRKTFTTKLLNNNVNIKAAQHLARHESERTTLRYYVAVTIEQAKSEHQRVMAN
jgi:integrase/recombinase XerD